MPNYHIRVSIDTHNVATGALCIAVLNHAAAVLTDPPNYDNMAADMSSHYGTAYLALLPSNYQLDRFVVRVWEEAGVAPGEGSHNVQLPGTRPPGDTGLSEAVCGMFSWYTNTPKRYSRGHMFWPPALDTAATTAGGNWRATNAYWTAALAFAPLYINPWSAGSTTYSPVIFSYTRFKKAESPYVFPITNWLAHPEQHFLRKRLTVP